MAAGRQPETRDRMTTTVAPAGDNRDYEILVRGNILAAQWSRRILGRRKLGRFFSCLLNPQRGESLGISPEKVEKIMAIPTEDRDAIIATQEVVNRVFTKFDRLAMKIARKFALNLGREYNEADVTQLESEARVGLLKAIRGYTRLTIKFITYAHKSIFNEVSRYVQRKMGLGLTGINATLLVRYKRKLEELYKASLPHSFEDVCRELKLNDKQIARLRDALRAQVTSESELEDSLATLLLSDNHSTAVDLDLIQRFNTISLPHLERYSWYAQSEDIRALFPNIHCKCCECEEARKSDPNFKKKFDSLRDVASHFNVTPQAASEALKRARKKLASALGKDWNPYA